MVFILKIVLAYVNAKNHRDLLTVNVNIGIKNHGSRYCHTSIISPNKAYISLKKKKQHDKHPARATD